MAKAKDPSQWTPAYRARMERAFAKNPYATKTEARRGANSKEAQAERKGSADDEQARTQGNIKAKISNVTLRQELGIITPKQAGEFKTQLKQMASDIKHQYDNLIPGTRAYHEINEDIKQAYWDLRAYGIIGEVDDDPWGEIFYN